MKIFNCILLCTWLWLLGSFLANQVCKKQLYKQSATKVYATPEKQADSSSKVDSPNVTYQQKQNNEKQNTQQ
ncbi:MAG TPA: hypothetical protein PLS94_15015 [Prolixibacteraceae bacterium]|nr:hypothetical protein [Prolixibacteraceae bacterium]